MKINTKPTQKITRSVDLDLQVLRMAGHNGDYDGTILYMHITNRNHPELTVAKSLHVPVRVGIYMFM